MRLEGTLDAFSLPDIFQLLSFTKKTGALHLRREAEHGVVYVRDGAVTGGRGDVACQSLGRRLVGAGLVDDDTLADAVERVLDTPGAGLGRALVDSGKVDTDVARELAVEQATDCVFELLRWPDGAFDFVMDESDPDDLGAVLAVEEVVAEGRRRLETWGVLAEKVSSTTAVVSLAPSTAAELVLSREEWALLSLVDSARTVGDLVNLAGTGSYVVMSVLASLAERGVVTVGERSEGTNALMQRQQLLAALEGRVVESRAPAAPAPAAPAPAPRAAEAPREPAAAPEARKPVIPERPEPFTADRRPAYAEEATPAMARYAAAAAAPMAATASVSSPAPTAPAATVGAVHGAHALQPDHAPAPSSLIDRDPSVNKSLLLRLIAGVRGL